MYFLTSRSTIVKVMKVYVYATQEYTIMRFRSQESPETRKWKRVQFPIDAPGLYPNYVIQRAPCNISINSGSQSLRLTKEVPEIEIVALRFGTRRPLVRARRVVTPETNAMHFEQFDAMK